MEQLEASCTTGESAGGWLQGTVPAGRARGKTALSHCSVQDGEPLDTVAFSLVSWHLAPGEHALLALEKHSWREEPPRAAWFSLSVFTAHFPFLWRPGQRPRTPVTRLKKPPLRPRSRSCKGQNPMRSARSLCLRLCRSPKAPPSVSGSPGNAISPELKALVFHHLWEAQGQPQSGENGRTSGGEGRCKMFSGVKRRDEKQTKLVWA